MTRRSNPDRPGPRAVPDTPERCPHTETTRTQTWVCVAAPGHHPGRHRLVAADRAHLNLWIP